MYQGFALAGALMVMTASGAAADEKILGTWQTPDGATIEVVHCATGICGDIIALTDRDGQRGEDIRDVNHPNAKRRNRKLVGTRIMRKVKSVGQDAWEGRVYHPVHGIRMTPTMKLISDDELELTACLKKMPSICQDEVWQRVE